MKRVLHLTLHRRWFDEIASGRKTQEYRLCTAFWVRRLEDRTYDEIQFRNGYNKDAPTMRVEWLGISMCEFDGQECYVISLGRILELSDPKNGIEAAEFSEARHASAQAICDPAVPGRESAASDHA